jgi:uncharacterized protein (DUF58 family)
LLIGLGLLGIGIFKTINLLTLLAWSLLAVFGLNALAARRHLSRLSGRRRLDDLVFAGSPVAVEVHVVNEGRKPCRGVRLEDCGPGHELRWFLECLEGHEARDLRGEVVLPRRGRYAWGPLAARSGWPLGLVWRRRPLVAGAEVVVLPRLGWFHRGLFRNHLRPAAARGAWLGRHGWRHRAAQDEFHGLRTFRTGDSPRAIHWRTSARRGELMVREFEDVPGEDLLLIVDPSPPAGAVGLSAEEAFEQVVSLAATLCWEWCRRKGDRLVLAVATSRPEVHDALTSQQHARRTLECLAGLAPGPADARALLADLAALPALPAVLIAAGPSPLADALRHGLRRPLTCFDASADLDFYQAPSEDRGQESQASLV